MARRRRKHERDMSELPVDAPAPARGGRFVVLEGGEASGKSTQVARLAARLRDRGLEACETFEPGATGLGARIRGIVLGGHETLSPWTEALLMAADRAEHVAEILRPALAGAGWVVSDRFVPSSLVYQGVARGLGIEEVDRISSSATGGLRADVVIVLDVPDSVARDRLVGRRDRIESAGEEFHARVRAAYRSLAPERGWRVVDGMGTVDEVSERVWAVVAGRFGL